MERIRLSIRFLLSRCSDHSRDSGGYSMREHLERIGELYRRGEILRGIKDTIVLNGPLPSDKIDTTGEIPAAGETITIRKVTPEEYWLVDGFGEQSVLEDYTERANPDTVVWDIGANVGVYSLFAAKKGATVVSIEPGIESISRLKKNARLNDTEGYITPLCIAVSDTNGFETLTKQDSSMIRSLSDTHSGGDVVPVFTGDSLNVPTPSVLKIDVEGHEYSVLQGLENTLQDVETVYIEIHGEPYIEILGLLWDSGFTITEQWNERGDNTHLRVDK